MTARKGVKSREGRNKISYMDKHLNELGYMRKKRLIFTLIFFS